MVKIQNISVDAKKNKSNETPFPVFNGLRSAPARTLCTDCGLSRLADPSRCGSMCQFIQPNYPKSEIEVHTRPRRLETDELFFGVTSSMVQAALLDPLEGAQWTGIVTRLAEILLEKGWVDGVITVGPAKEDRWKPEPRLITDPLDMAECRGMRMGFSPNLALLDDVKSKGIKKLLFIGIPCQVHALRGLERSALKADYGLDDLFVIGTPCSDNTTTEHFHRFLKALDTDPDRITYLEFRSDYRVEIRYQDGQVRLIPFLDLPLSQLGDDFFPLTCQSCVDYTNALSDITIGYMAGRGEQWLIARNKKGEDLLNLLRPEMSVKPVTTSGDRRKAVEGFRLNTERAAGGLPLRRIPRILRPLVSYMQRWFGPKGLEFAKTRLEMKALESILHLRRAAPSKVKNMVPEHVWKMAESYGLFPLKTERKKVTPPLDDRQ